MHQHAEWRKLPEIGHKLWKKRLTFEINYRISTANGAEAAGLHWVRRYIHLLE